ncbi:uncharacterized protein LOC113762485 [Coffea eugenioides]|uniref:PAR1 protein n=1 Tax=Coffea arabica TaxID=13443 RepID=A0A6P6W4N9_COFAR|nr:uncharacterized protein LOC113730062 [Coffea arabica]XP_027161750.1 uncharacterized protein LOC113762485 [Coffea eugenioides]
MAPSSSSLIVFAFIALACALCVQSTSGNIACEDLKEDSCAYAVSSSGKRCVLEKHVRRSGEEKYTCRASDIEAEKLKDWIETDKCIEACGVDRHALGISSDSLLEPQFTHKLCSSACYRSCPNIVDLYFNLAAGEGVYLPKLCEAQRGHGRREMAEIKSSGMVAPGPESDGGKPVSFYIVAPAPPPY